MIKNLSGGTLGEGVIGEGGEGKGRLRAKFNTKKPLNKTYLYKKLVRKSKMHNLYHKGMLKKK